MTSISKEWAHDQTVINDDSFQSEKIRPSTMWLGRLKAPLHHMRKRGRVTEIYVVIYVTMKYCLCYLGTCSAKPQLTSLL